MSDRRTLANRTNASKSTGPNTVAGKSNVSRNAIQHGLRSQSLLLEDEDPDALAQLQAELFDALRPVGAIELALAERIVTAVWRQRRIEVAETAALAIRRRSAEIVDDLERLHDYSERAEISEDCLREYDPVQLEWCQSVVSEIDGLKEISAESILARAPLVSTQVQHDAREDQEPVETYLANYPEGATAYIGELYAWCRKQIAASENRPQLLALAEQVRAARLILSSKQLETLARYQTTLDNQLYKALRAFREAQEWRLKTLENCDREDQSGATLINAA